MTYVITQLCTNDGACVEVCPVACIHTTPGAAQHYVDPDVCIECEQCKIVCPVEAIFIDKEVPPDLTMSLEVNASFFRKNKAIVGPVPMTIALDMIHAAQTYATEAGLAVAVAVVDEAGAPIAVGRMDGADPRSPELAFHKAYTAAAFQVPTQQLQPEARQPFFRALTVGTHGRIMSGGGGIPIVDGVIMIGAIGVAGGGKDEADVQCARAGLGVLDGPSH